VTGTSASPNGGRRGADLAIFPGIGTHSVEGYFLLKPLGPTKVKGVIPANRLSGNGA